MGYQLNAEQKLDWQQHGFLKIENLLSDDDKKNVQDWTDELQSWPEEPGKWMNYYEYNNGQRLLCRIENFLDYHVSLNELLTGSKMIDILSGLMNEKAVLFKEKINFKFVGANGFKPHQDAPAFVSFNQTYHITMMLAVDAATMKNGCLQIAKGWSGQRETLATNSDGSITQEVCDQLSWSPLSCSPGDIIFFDSYVPHYSESNNSDKPRRAFFVTYNRAVDGGCRRADYYKDKREKFPPECERDPDKDYSKGAVIYNTASPIKI